MGSYDLVDVEVTHESADDLFDSLSEDGAYEDHLQSIQAVRLQAGQPDSELRSLKELDENSVKLLEHQVDAAYRALFVDGWESPSRGRSWAWKDHRGRDDSQGDAFPGDR
jgi:hypothetical protein